MYHRRTGSYDEIPEGMMVYLNNYGCHFNKKLWKLLESYGIKLKRNKLYDAAYAASMCKADFLGKSVPDEKHLAQYVKDVLDDADADEGYLFNRWYADQMFMGNPVDWEEYI